MEGRDIQWTEDTINTMVTKVKDLASFYVLLMQYIGDLLIPSFE